jgi:hypothetical protein
MTPLIALLLGVTLVNVLFALPMIIDLYKRQSKSQ